MCGIVGIVRKPKEAVTYDLDVLLTFLSAIKNEKSSLLSVDSITAAKLAKELISVNGIVALVKNVQARESIEEKSNSIRCLIEEILSNEQLNEDQKALLTDLNDAFWRMGQDACMSANQISGLLSQSDVDISIIEDYVVAIYRSINLVLRSLDRIEVRGRDSAGISLALKNVEVDSEDISKIEARRNSVFSNGSVQLTSESGNSVLYFVYKRAAEIGELGDNVAHLRELITSDELLKEILFKNPKCHEMVLAHTRWASMGVISEENTHPLDSQETSDSAKIFSVGVLNGDIDNHVELREECNIAPSITTDAKLIPILYSHERENDTTLDSLETYRKVVSKFEGSTAIALMAADNSESMVLALRGGGQGLFIGLGQDEYFIASEPYGVVEVADSYIRVDGEIPRDSDQPIASRGQLFSLSEKNAGSIDGLSRLSYDGVEMQLTNDDVVASQVTTRDIDRGAFTHYLWKEINEAPKSFTATLQGKFDLTNNTADVNIVEEIFPQSLQQKINTGQIEKVLIVGQGTAAVAGLACEHFFKVLESDLHIKATLATEVSGFSLQDDMKDTLVIAVSQSGTTTDTNRTVDLLKDRGACVLAIVNRRGSDLATKADGVYYTSSGRDVEMSVASTKAFYAQVAAGAYIAIAVEKLRNQISNENKLVFQIIESLLKVPELMTEVFAQRDQIEEIAKRTVLSRRSWATVGNGPNVIAAREIRIKSSELCYKAIALDSTEDKKHIDLSSEPLIVVCASGIDGSNADDVAKEVAIYKAHKACPIVITDDDSHRFQGQENVIMIPKIHSDVSFILACVAGHILGYESAIAIDKSATVLREARGALGEIDSEILNSFGAINKIGDALRPYAVEFFQGLAKGNYDAVLDASDAGDLTKLFIAFAPPFNLDLLNDRCGGLQTPQSLLNCAVSTLTHSIDQLTRPIDAIRHQAKTVTVGISRSDDTLLRSPSVAYVIEQGVERDLLSFPAIRTLLALDEIVENFLHLR